MKSIEDKIIEAYEPYVTTLREVGRIVGTDHHRVKRVLQSEGIEIAKGKIGPFTDEHRLAISKACKGRPTWSKGKKMPKGSLYKNMASHLRFDVTVEWLSNFCDIEKLKFLNRVLTNRGGGFDFDTNEYELFIEKFYNDDHFNDLYSGWIVAEKNQWLRPTIDHITPKAKGGGNNLENLQFLTWFENRAKCDMTQDEWNKVKLNMKDYLI